MHNNYRQLASSNSVIVSLGLILISTVHQVIFPRHISLYDKTRHEEGICESPVEIAPNPTGQVRERPVQCKIVSQEDMHHQQLKMRSLLV